MVATRPFQTLSHLLTLPTALLLIPLRSAELPSTWPSTLTSLDQLLLANVSMDAQAALWDSPLMEEGD